VFTPVASDPERARLTFSISNKPAWASFSTSTGRLAGTPAGTDAGTFSNIIIRVTDGRTWTSLAAFSITVTPAASANSPPTISGAPATTVLAGAGYQFTPVAQDSDGDTVQFSISGRPSWATFDVETGSLTGTPTASQAGTYPNIRITVSDGRVAASLPAFSITVTVPTMPNSAPTIAGTPATSVTATHYYAFTPVARDQDGDALGFLISGKPVWATFSTATGSLTGTPGPSQAGPYWNIIISVSDGKLQASLPPFAIMVNPEEGTATLSWTAPTQNTDGSPLTDLAGFRVYHGASPGSLNEMTQLPGATTTSYTYGQLASGTHYFAVSAYNSAGGESELSDIGAKVIP
jgi:nitrite reductase/ring-hydroxylating ferredoxin subunit